MSDLFHNILTNTINTTNKNMPCHCNPYNVSDRPDEDQYKCQKSWCEFEGEKRFVRVKLVWDLILFILINLAIVLILYYTSIFHITMNTYTENDDIKTFDPIRLYDDVEIGEYIQTIDYINVTMGLAGIYISLIILFMMNYVKYFAYSDLIAPIGLFGVVIGVVLTLISFGLLYNSYLNDYIYKSSEKSWNSGWGEYSNNNVYPSISCDGYDYKVEYDGLYNSTECNVYQKYHSDEYVSHCCASIDYVNVDENSIDSMYLEYQYEMMDAFRSVMCGMYAVYATFYLSLIPFYRNKIWCGVKVTQPKGIELTIV